MRPVIVDVYPVTVQLLVPLFQVGKRLLETDVLQVEPEPVHNPEEQAVQIPLFK